MKNENSEINSMSVECAQSMQEHWKSEESTLLLERNQLNSSKRKMISDTDVITDAQCQPCEDEKSIHGFVNSPLRIGLKNEQIFSKEAKNFKKGKMDDRKDRDGIKQQLRLNKFGRLTIVFRSEERKPNRAKNYDLISRNRRHSQVGSPKRPITLLQEYDRLSPRGLASWQWDYSDEKCFRAQLVQESLGLVPLASTRVGQVGFIGDLTMSNNTSNPNEEGFSALLPDRVIRGLSEATWPVVTEENAFKAVSLWEFTNLYVLLGKKDWLTLSTYLKGTQLSALSRKVGIGLSVLSNIRDSPEQSIVVPNLKRLCEEVEMDLLKVERSVKAVRFNTRGALEQLKFPFVMDIYSWRVLCHIAGDGNVHFRKYPNLRWIQLPENQDPMRTLLSRLSREVGGEGDQIWYPKAFSYAMMGTMSGITFRDLRTPSFLQFVLNLPPRYRDWKVQFLAAFIVDDGCISKDISFYQKDDRVLHLIMRLCDQLGYDHSPLYRQKRDGVHNFQLRQEGIKSFAYDVAPLFASDPLLGLWHKHTKLLSVASSFSSERKLEQEFSVFVCTTILQILGDYNIYTTDDLREHPKLQHYLVDVKHYVFTRKLEFLHRKMGLIREALKNDEKHYRPKRWFISPPNNSEDLIKDFHELYNNRAHAQSYERRFIPRSLVVWAIGVCEAEGVEPTALNVSRLLKCSKKLLYERDDLRDLFINDEE